MMDSISTQTLRIPVGPGAAAGRRGDGVGLAPHREAGRERQGWGARAGCCGEARPRPVQADDPGEPEETDLLEMFRSELDWALNVCSSLLRIRRLSVS